MYWKKIILMVSAVCLMNFGAAAAADKWQDLKPGADYNYKQLKFESSQTGATLIFSDSPEYVKDYGVLYEDNLQGDIRIFYYHVNDKWPQAKIAVLVQNNDLAAANIKINRTAMPKPSIHWLAGAKAVQQAYFDKQKPYSFKLNMFEKVDLLSGTDGLVYNRDELAQGIIELHADKPVNIKIISLPISADVREYADIAPQIPADDVRPIPLRGTFSQADRQVVIQPFDLVYGMAGVTIADGDIDKFAVGIDAMTGKKAENYGNYGVFYEIYFQNKTEDKMTVRLNAAAGLIAGQLMIGDSKGKKMRKVNFPESGLNFGETGLETVSLGEYPAGFKGKIIFSPPGTSNLPIRLFFYKAEE